ncbi:glycosyltransferase [Bacillus mycoides]|uniref:glycosyltransferase n=1 Tax=Bacillus mycoides TaxID=1405 RepID=UPI003D1F5EFB
MKILYFGTVCNEDSFEKICSNSKIKPSAAPQNFEMSLIKGIDKISNVEIQANAFVPIPAFPNGYLLFWGRKKEKLTDNITTKWLPAINIQVIKQLCLFLFSFLVTLIWLIENRNDRNKVITLYSIYAPVACGIIPLAKLAKCKVNVIVPDLPSYMFTYTEVKGIKSKLIPFFLSVTKSIDSKFDGYIFLTKFMQDVINKKNKSYIIIEGIANDEDLLYENEKLVCSEKKAIMYAGALNEKFGIDKLIEAFKAIPDAELELWLFGDGDMVDEIIKHSQKDARIKYFGRKTRSEILKYERKATVLVNIRTTNDEYTKYSFPSKTIEYMASGTPLLTTKLPGIPLEYYNYCYTIEDETLDGIATVLNKISKLPDDELRTMGNSAREFIISNKSAKMQAEKICSFLEKIADE